MAGIFPPLNQGGRPPGPNVCNGYSPEHTVLGEGPLYYSSDCTTTLTDCAANAPISEILAAVDKLGYPYNTARVDNLGTALVDTIDHLNARIDERVLRSGDTMTGPLELARTPVDPMEAANKLYVDETAEAAADACCTAVRTEFAAADAALLADINTRVRISGDQMTGPLILSGDPTVDDGAATKKYVDDQRGYIIIEADPPTGVQPNRLWWNSTDGALYIRYDDGTSVQWVQACGPCTTGEVRPADDGEY